MKILDDTILMPNGNPVKDNLGLRSEIVQEILTRKPSFLERWSLIIFLFILVSIICGTWFIEYPEVIEATATLTAINAPKEIVTRSEGRLNKLFVKNGEQITEGSIIGLLECTASYQEVIRLSNIIDSSNQLLLENNYTEISLLFNQPFNNLGELQPAYQQFQGTWQLFSDFFINGYYESEKNFLQREIVSSEQMNIILQEQKQLTESDIKLSERTFAMNKSLFEQKVISEDEFRIQESKFVNRRLSIPRLKAELIQNNSRIRSHLREIDQVTHNALQQKLIFSASLKTLKSEVDKWINRYLLRSPVAGKVAFTIPLQEYQFIQQGKMIGFINPNSTYYYAEVNLPQTNFGKVHTGQSVQLRFEAYPYQEYGAIMGTISYVSMVPSDSGFLANIRLENPQNKQKNHAIILYKSGLKAHAIIITRRTRLMERMYYNLIKLFSGG